MNNVTVDGNWDCALCEKTGENGPDTIREHLTNDHPEILDK